MGDETGFQYFKELMGIALAVAIIRTKPAGLNTSEYCLHLRQKIIEKMLEGNREKSMLTSEMIRLKEQLISQQIMEKTSKQQCEQLPSDISALVSFRPNEPAGCQGSNLTACGRSGPREAILKSCLTCSSLRFGSSDLPRFLDSFRFLLDSIKFMATNSSFSSCLVVDHILVDLVVETLLRSDAHLLSMTSLGSICLTDFFVGWIAQFVSSGGDLNAGVQRDKSTVVLLRHLSSGRCLRAAILEAIVFHLARVTTALTPLNTVHSSLDVLAWQDAATLLLAMELVLPTEVAATEHCGHQWQNVLRDCLRHLYPHFPLYVHRIYRMTDRLPSSLTTSLI